MRSLLTEPINRFYYGYLINTQPVQHIIADADQRDLLVCVRESFTAGARWQLRETSKLSPYISRFLEMVVLLGPDSPRDAFLTVIDDADEPDNYDIASAYPDPIDHAPF